MSLPKKVTIVEVSPRDGLQNEVKLVPTNVKIEFINLLADAGLSVIEAASFVSPKWIPQLADGAEVLAGIQSYPGVRYPVLIPNVQGLERAMTAGAKEVAVFTTPSEQFSMKNTHCTVEESLERIEQVLQIATVPVRAYISCVLGCPYEGDIDVQAVAKLAERLIQMGCYEVSLGDTIGIGTALKTKHMLQAVLNKVPMEKLAVHFHDTYGQALVNIYVALELGIATIDSSVFGLGGCPYAKGASGNVATEDVLYLLHGMGIETGVDLEKLRVAGHFIASYLSS